MFLFLIDIKIDWIKINENFWFYDIILLFNLFYGFYICKHFNYFLNSILKDKTDTRFTKKNHFNPVSIYNIIYITLHLINNNRIPFRKIYADRRRVSLNFHERVGSFDKARVRKARENRVADSLGRRQREKTRRRAKRSSFRDRRCAPRLLKPGLDSKLPPIGSGFLSLRHGKERVEKDGGGEVRESRKK